VRRYALRCNRRSSCGFSCLPGRKSQTEETVGFRSAITWLTNAATRLRRWICCWAIPVVAPWSGDSVRWRRCRVQRSGSRSGSTLAPPQFFLDTPKLCRGRRVAMSTGLLEFGLTTSKHRVTLLARAGRPDLGGRRPLSTSVALVCISRRSDRTRHSLAALLPLRRRRMLLVVFAHNDLRFRCPADDQWPGTGRSRKLRRIVPKRQAGCRAQRAVAGTAA
jgi:hypothetical protein